MDDLAMTLHEHPRNSKVDILRIVAILLTINRDAWTVNQRSKRHLEKIIEKIYKVVLEDAHKSKQGKQCSQ